MMSLSGIFFVSIIRDENVTNLTSFSLNSLASFWAIVVHLLQVKLLWRRKRLSQLAIAAVSSSLLSLTVAYICFTIALIILQDTLSWRARVSFFPACLSQAPGWRPSSSLHQAAWPCCCPPWTDTEARFFFFFSVTLLGSTEKHLAAASPRFPSAYFRTESLNFKLYFFFFLLHRRHGYHQCQGVAIISEVRGTNCSEVYWVIYHPLAFNCTSP